MFKVEESFPDGSIFSETEFNTRYEAVEYMYEQYHANQEHEDDINNSFVLYERGWIKSPVDIVFN